MLVSQNKPDVIKKLDFEMAGVVKAVTTKLLAEQASEVHLWGKL